MHASHSACLQYNSWGSPIHIPLSTSVSSAPCHKVRTDLLSKQHNTRGSNTTRIMMRQAQKPTIVKTSNNNIPLVYQPLHVYTIYRVAYIQTGYVIHKN